MTESHLKIFFAAILCLVFSIYWIRGVMPFEKERKRRLDKYWRRSCTGSDWRKAFPKASKDSIRAYLESFTDGFAFPSKRSLKFSPDDKIRDIYTALYPSNNWIGGDALELETFSMIVKKEYGINLTNVLTDDLTLGQLFEMATKANPNKEDAPDQEPVR